MHASRRYVDYTAFERNETVYSTLHTHAHTHACTAAVRDLMSK